MLIDRFRHQLAATAVLTSVAMLTACSGDDTAQGRAAPEPVVVIEAVTAQSVPNIVELPGRIEAVRTAEVRARVDGIVQRRLFEEGSDVREGDVLFKIDPRQKQARLAQAEAQLARMIATRDNAIQVVNRYAPLVARRAVSAQENDAATATLRQAEADVAQARAVVDNERLELAYTTVRAPLTGRVGKAAVTEGALVSAASATLLTRIDQLNPVYVTFTQSSSDMIDLRQRLESGAVSAPAMNLIEVRLILANGSKYGPVGHLDFADLAVDPSTGSQIIRARFDNAKLYLLPGQFVRGRISAGVSQMASAFHKGPSGSASRKPVSCWSARTA
ncbi:MAG: efflux RND transporter periplasmic adaptor subunit [Gammaproteobacteria bacterium]